MLNPWRSVSAVAAIRALETASPFATRRGGASCEASACDVFAARVFPYDLNLSLSQYCVTRSLNGRSRATRRLADRYGFSGADRDRLHRSTLFRFEGSSLSLRHLAAGWTLVPTCRGLFFGSLSVPGPHFVPAEPVFSRPVRTLRCCSSLAFFLPSASSALSLPALRS